MKSALVLLASLASISLATRLRIASWNILADYFDPKDIPQHHWKVRSPFIQRTIQERSPDIVGLQELTSRQATEIAGWPGYEMYTLCHHDEGIPAGMIAKGTETEAWIGKREGALLTSIMYKKDSFECIDRGRFWLQPEPNTLPASHDRSTDKGFGNTKTNRAVLWLKLRHLASGRIVFFFNSHYPLDGNDATRYGCAFIERQLIRQIAGDSLWFSTGDRNTIGPKRGQEQKNIIAPLFEEAFDAVSNWEAHFGYKCSWAGFLSDNFRNPILETGQFSEDPNTLDFVVSSQVSLQSAHVLPVFDPETGQLEYSPAVLKENRCWASDHIMVEADYEI